MKIKYKVPSDKYLSVGVCFLFALQKYRLVLCNHCVATRAGMCIFTGVVLDLWGDTFLMPENIVNEKRYLLSYYNKRDNTDGKIETMEENTKNKLLNASHFVLLGLLVSFIGWTIETVYCSYYAGQFVNRGFITLPFCTIYGFCVMIMFFLFGTPVSGGILIGKITNKPLRFLIYFIAAVIIPSATELITGLFFEKATGVVLWTYKYYKFNLWGYVCLRFSLIWGVLITLSMWLLFPLLKKLTDKIPYLPSVIISSILLAAISADLIFRFIKLLA